MKHFFFTFFILLFLGCNKTPDYVIPKDTLVPLIVDLHLADAVFTNRGVIDLDFDTIDSASYYQSIFNQYSINRVDFDSTMDYLTAQPRKMDVIYDEVIERLSKMEAEAAELRDREMELEEEEIWKGPKNILLPQDSARSKIPFRIKAKPGTYRITARIRIFLDDESKDPSFVSYFWYDDGTKDGRKINIRKMDLKKNNRFQYYRVTKRLIKPENAFLSGKFVDHENQDSIFTKHAAINDISITYKPLP